MMRTPEHRIGIIQRQVRVVGQNLEWETELCRVDVRVALMVRC